MESIWRCPKYLSPIQRSISSEKILGWKLVYIFWTRFTTNIIAIFSYNYREVIMMNLIWDSFDKFITPFRIAKSSEDLKYL